MRDIKFRAYVKDKNKIYDVKEIDFVNKLIRFEEEGKPTDTMRMLDQVEPMQFTGLEDMNGKEIYEGDIVKMGYTGSRKHKIYEIFYDVETGQLLMRNGDEIDDCENVYGVMARTNTKVIGNVYDNPELLKEHK